MTTALASIPPPTNTLTLDDGRILAWDEHGDMAGFPVCFFHGAPGSRVLFPGMADAAATAGVRLFAIDRPGCGRSSFQPGRRIADWPTDVTTVVDYIGLDRFAVCGISGGGPYAVACASLADPRLSRAAVVSGIGPLDTGEAIAGLHDVNRSIFELASTGPQAAVTAIEAMVQASTGEPAAGDAMTDLFARLAPEDQALIVADPQIMAAARIDESAALGAAGPSYDLWLYTRPWDLDLRSISVEVDIYSGDHDHNVPVQHAVDQAAAIPTSTLTVWPASGHFAGIQRFDEILARLTAS